VSSNYPIHMHFLLQVKADLNSPGTIVCSTDNRYLSRPESTFNKVRWGRGGNIRCRILSAGASYQYFENLTLLSVIYLSKTRYRSAFLREIYNLNTFITYEMSWNFHSWWNQTFRKRWWPQNSNSIMLSVSKP